MSTNSTHQVSSRLQSIVNLLALLVAFVSFVVSVLVWQAVSLHQPMWPIPALYLIEILSLSIAAAIAVIRGSAAAMPMAAVAFGCTATFSTLAAWSVGLFYAPVALLLLLTGLLYTWSAKRSLLWYLAWVLGAGMVQIGIIAIALRLLNLASGY